MLKTLTCHLFYRRELAPRVATFSYGSKNESRILLTNHEGRISMMSLIPDISCTNQQLRHLNVLIARN